MVSLAAGCFRKLFIASAVRQAMSYEESGRREEENENDVGHAPDSLLSIEWTLTCSKPGRNYLQGFIKACIMRLCILCTPSPKVI